MRTFFVVWFGQLISTLGSGLSGFALGVWIYQETGSTTLYAMSMLAYALPTVLLSPLTGALVDRWERRRVMMLSDAGAGLATLAIALLYLSGRLHIWHIYLATALNASFTGLQWPAYSAATSLLVPKEHLGRAGGMVQIGEAVSQLVAPAIAGAMLVTIGLPGVLLTDFATFAFAVGTLIMVRFPPHQLHPAGQEKRTSLFKDAAFGWRYILARPGLLGLLVIFALSNLFFGLTNPLLAPMILELTTADRLGFLASIAGLGMLLGTLVMSVWGGPKRRIHGVLGYMAASGLFIALLGLRPWLPLMTFAGFCLMFLGPIINGSSQALWQTKVAADVQGRVFSIRRMIAWSTTPLAYLIAGPLADRVFTPLLMPGGLLADSVGLVLGVGRGRGIALLFVLVGLLTVIVSLGGYALPRIRRVEQELPDAVGEATPAAATPEPATALST